MPKICRKCESEFPIRVKIDGKYRNLNNRKFCLNCSPFGSHNTKPDDPQREKVKSKRYSEWTEVQRERNKAQQYYYRHKRMKKAIELKGGKCEECGYNKCNRSLCFHHINPEEKSFEITSRTILSNSWERIEEELNKCSLLCHNCHCELHDKEQTTKYAKLIKEMYDYDV